MTKDGVTSPMIQINSFEKVKGYGKREKNKIKREKKLVKEKRELINYLNVK